MSLTPQTEFDITITMTSDWHIGSGAGHGEIDSTVQRDSDGLPYIPAKTLTGILRDGCEQITQALDGNSSGKWHQWINFLFGDQPALAAGALERSPQPAIVSIRSAYFAPELRNALGGKKQLANAIAFIKPGVAIEPATGSAKPECLRLEEVVRMGAVLTAKNCTLDFSEVPDIGDDGKKAAYALLVAGAKMVGRLGGKRRRGNGSCTITLPEKSNEWLQWFKEHYNEIAEPPQWKQSVLLKSTHQNQASDSTWYSIPLTVTTTSPIVLPARTVGNVVECLDYIPGRYLLRYLHRMLGDKFDVSQAIACGDLVITNATISINDKAGRPIPFCLFAEKLDGGLNKGKGVYNRFQEPEPSSIQLKGERSGYVGEFNGAELPDHKTVSLELYTHNTIRDEVQRPTSDIGGVYSYQAIPAKTKLVAELRLPKSIKDHLDLISEDWWQEVSGDLRIGQSKKDQYGAVTITANQPTEYQLSETEHLELLYV
jgi:CRISPR-associated protein Csx10